MKQKSQPLFVENLFDLSDYPCDFEWCIFYWILDISNAQMGISFWCFFTNTISYIINFYNNFCRSGLYSL